MFQGLMQRPVYRTQCRTWRKAAELGLCQGGFRALPAHRPLSVLQARKQVADAIRQERKSALSSYRKRRFFDRAFESDSPPVRLRAFAEWFCLNADVNGISDPMWICNIVAYEVGVGDGLGCFDCNTGSDTDQSEVVGKAARRLRHAYSSCLAGNAIADAELIDHIRKAVTP